MAFQVHSASPDELTVRLLHDLLRLRTDVFVVEQECPYPELDGHDLEPGTRHLWIEEQGKVIATLRLLAAADATTIGRVATHGDHRGRGLASALLQQALHVSGGPWQLSAQTYLQSWYEAAGFIVTGAEFLEDGIPHIPMSRPIS